VPDICQLRSEIKRDNRLTSLNKIAFPLQLMTTLTFLSAETMTMRYYGD
jgi:hypothetical protein